MPHPKRTLLIGLVAAVAAVAGGAFVADASNHPSLGSAATQGGPGSGRFAGPPGQGGPPSPAGAARD